MIGLNRQAYSLIKDSETDPLCRAQLFSDGNVFEAEQKKFAHDAWNLLCIANDIPKDNDWITDSLSGRPIVVHRLGKTITGFENLCLSCRHVFFRGQSGNSPLRCDVCEAESFWRPIDIETCGGLVFGRIPFDSDSTCSDRSLKNYLGKWDVIFKELTQFFTAPLVIIDQVINANWKFSYQLTLDDYHFVHIHPDSFGMGGYLNAGAWRYAAEGAHSVLVVNRDGVAQNWIEKFLEGCGQGTLPLHSYVIFQIFPNIAVVLIEYQGVWLVLISRYIALTAESTAIKTWIFLAPGQGEDIKISKRTTAKKAMAGVAMLTQIYNEDGHAAEQLQHMIRQTTEMPFLATTEERIGWFECAYHKFMLEGEKDDANCRTSVE